MALIKIETELERENHLVRVEVEYGSYPDEFFINSVIPMSVTDENGVETPCQSNAELLTTPEEDRQLLADCEAHWQDHEGKRAIERSQRSDLNAWRNS